MPDDFDYGGLVSSAGDWLDKGISGYTKILSLEAAADQARYARDVAQFGLASEVTRAQGAATVAAIQSQTEVAKARNQLTAAELAGKAATAVTATVSGMSRAEIIGIILAGAGTVFAFMSLRGRA